MSKATLLVYTNCPADQEEAFNRWYDTVHVPDLLKIEGITAARRFKLAGPGPQMQTRGEPAVAQYLAMYELDSDDTRTMMKRINDASVQLGQQGRMFDGLQLVAATTYLALGERQTAGG